MGDGDGEVVKNRQRYGYKQHWSNEYRKLITWRKVMDIMKTHFQQRITDDIFVERPIITMLLKRR